MTSVSTLLTAVGLPNRPMLDRERRLVARLAAVALDRVEERGLLAADVGAGAAAELDVEGEAGAQHVVAEQAGRARLVDRVLRAARAPAGTRRGCRGSRAAPIAKPAIVIASTTANGSLLHHDAVLERARLGLVGVAHEVVRLAGCAATASHLRPVGNAAPPRPTSFAARDLVDDGLRADLDGALRERLEAAGGAVVVERRRVDAPDPGEQPEARLARLGREAAGSTRAARRARPELGADAVAGPSSATSAAAAQRVHDAHRVVERRRPSAGSSPATVNIAAGARSHWPRHGLPQPVVAAVAGAAPAGPSALERPR